MRIPNDSPWRACALLVALLALPSAAEPDSFGLGAGRTGAVTIGDAGTIINRYAVVASARQPGDQVLPVDDATGFSPSDLVLVLQTTGMAPAPPSGDAGPFELTGTGVGAWELARVASVDAGVDGGVLLLTAPLAGRYAASFTQIVQVPEYTDLTIPPGASIVARPWNGASGGVVALLASGVVTNGGNISVDQAGFQGGVYQDDGALGSTGCTGLDQPWPQGGQKGEGIAPSLYGGIRSGYGNVANGGGGGDCHDSGGGGGGNAGAGGTGGLSYDGARDVGGRGGAALTYSLMDRLTLGGGGGAGYGHGGQGTSGGAGGGAIFVRALQLSGAGTISADGQTTQNAGGNGAGGGGAGGSIYLRIAGHADCRAISAAGGDGGWTGLTDTGPGGGGGGGRILLQAGGGACPMSTGAGLAGQNGSTGAAGPTYGAAPTSPTDPVSQGSVVLVDGGYGVPPVPVLSAPADGLVTSSLRPAFAGTASPGVTVILLVDGAELGRVGATDAGDFAFQPAADLPVGSHGAQAQAEFQSSRSTPSALHGFTVVAPDGGSPDGGPASPARLSVGCGCGTTASNTLPWALVVLLLALAKARRRAPPGGD